MAQLLVEGGEPERNLARAAELAREAATRQCDAVLFPECLDLGWTHPSALTEAEPIPGRCSDFFGALARELGLFLCAGLTERDGDRVYNAAILLDPKGDIVLKYRKINLLVVEQPFYSVGRSIAVVETQLGAVGVNICADNYSDSLALGHTLGRMGAEIILSPSSWTTDFSTSESTEPYRDKWTAPYSVLARAYGLVIVGTTSVGYIVGGPYEGKKMVGCSLAVGPEGILARGPYLEIAGELIVVDVPLHGPLPLGTAVGARLGAL